ncbi:hypothetical protein BGZ93_000633, partial [Podila epicladia]
PSGMSGRMDMLVSIPSRKQPSVLEWKFIHIYHIRIGSGASLARANVISEIPDANTLLDLKFQYDKFRAGQDI